ncbi:hypothetical protein H8S90_02005 [Olivibacter sp. SDN3]|uniref:hypothetical protein n=1 Tax=Olivibacter sp. SDN3 TaxID=2764720 RepID=UPI0016519E66|nr:hypothetical protein [Olivibacter sp. SDN3]QNL50420.1 hypothetical protein H8S90_02005 [Olivibacter sp. SDN3]
MKKYLFLMIALVGLAGFSGCRKTEVVETAIMPNRTFIYTVNSNEWQYSEDGLTLLHDINLPELERYYLEQGNVSVAISIDNEQSYEILPATYNGYAYSVNYTVGFVTLKVEDPIIDPEIELQPPGTSIVVKIVLSDSDYID